MTVSIADDVIVSGNSVMIKGSVTDISAGTKQQDASCIRLPQGVHHAVSDASHEPMDGSMSIMQQANAHMTCSRSSNHT